MRIKKPLIFSSGKIRGKKCLIIFILLAVVLPFFALHAAKPSKSSQFLYGAWLPYWKKQEALQEISPNIQKFNELSPFSYEVNSSGKLIDKFKIDDESWTEFLKNENKNPRLKIIPTIAWFSGKQIHDILKNPKTREKHIAEIVSLVETKSFDGIDIDYENKKAETAASFSRFIKILSGKLRAKNKILSCSVEARTPLHSRFIVIPKDLKYANDYYVLGKYCDEVRVLAYDQRNIDLVLNKEKGGMKLYMPVADNDWVEKVIKETKRYVAPQKIMLGIPTFGHEYEIKKDGEKYVFERIKSVTYKSAVDLANSLNLKPERNSADELSFIYATSSVLKTESVVLISASSTENLLATSTRFVSFNDVLSMSDKIKLAKKYKLRGVIFFKFDGETDPELWKKF